MSLPRPDLVLRVAVVGSRRLPAPDPTDLRGRLGGVFDALSKSLASLAPGTTKGGAPPEVTDYYSNTPPLLRLVSGLADGTDQLASEVFLQTRPTDPVRREIAAVLPSDVATYEAESPVQAGARFAGLVRVCRYVIELDGRLATSRASGPTNPMRALCRARAFRAQSAVLLRQCDLLIAVADPLAPGRPGGTRETVQRALDLGIPVLFLPTTTAAAQVIHSLEDLEPAPGMLMATGVLEFCELATAIVADPQTARRGPNTTGDPGPRPLTPDEVALLEEYFSDRCYGHTFHERLWGGFLRVFKRAGQNPPHDPDREPFSMYRNRARLLNYYYVGRYRGAFLLNYLLAVVAVALAVFSNSILVELEAGTRAGLHLWNVLLLDSLKLAVVGAILWNTHKANRGRWNDRAIDFRYLAERLRALLYLPQVANLRPPPATVGRYASGSLRQSVADWLFQAILRQASPNEAMAGTPTTATIRPDAGAGVQAIRAQWLAVQIGYHDSNSWTMRGLARFLQRFGSGLNLLVVAVVLTETLLVVGAVVGGPRAPQYLRWLDGWGAVFALLTALLPTAVASLNGVRFQSECDRLADRSSVTVPVLRSLQNAAEKLDQRIADATRNPAIDPGAWILEALEIADSCAQITADEVAEWSVLYAKEIPET